MENFLKRNLPRLSKILFSDESHLEAYKDDNELYEEDSDAKAEREKVYSIPRNLYSKYPLIIKDIRKVYPGFNGQLPKIANKNISIKI